MRAYPSIIMNSYFFANIVFSFILDVIKKSLKKFPVISLISTFELYFKNMASKYVDSNNVDLTLLFKDDSEFDSNSSDIVTCTR
jgi:hypothetical protein